MDSLANDVKTSGTSMALLGGIAIFLGFLAMLAPGLTGITVAVFVGIAVLLGGVARMIWAFKAGSLGKGILTFIIGALTLVCGIVLVTDPLLASGFLTIMLAIYFIIDGIAEMAAGFQGRPASGSGWLIFAGIMSVVLGIIIWRQFPLSGAYAIGILLGIKLFMVGMVMITGGSGLRSVGKDAGA